MFVTPTEFDIVLRGLILAAAGLAWVVVLIRINGLRSLSKMTNFDFVMTVALGSLVAGAGQSEDWGDFGQALVAMTGLFLAQWTAARLRQSHESIEDVIQNEPVMLMRDGEILEGALERTRMAKSDLLAKLREANVLDFSQVRAVVLETTGDVSVLHGEKLSERLIEGVAKA